MKKQKLYLTDDERQYVRFWMPNIPIAEISRLSGLSLIRCRAIDKRTSVMEAKKRKLDYMIRNSLIDQARILGEEQMIATVDVGDLYDSEGNPIPINELPETVRRAIASVEEQEIETKDGKKIIRKYRFWNKGDSLNRLQKCHGMQTERKEVDKNLQIRVVDTF